MGMEQLKMLFKKTPDFTNNEFGREFIPKYMEICSQNENTFSLTIWWWNVEIMITDINN